MKVTAFSVTLVLLLGLALADDEQVCDNTIKAICKSPKDGAKGFLKSEKCSAAVGSFNIGTDGAAGGSPASMGFQRRIQDLIQHHFEVSMQYLEIANYFNEWTQNRKGFHAYFMKMSDDTWEDGVKILQHVVLRGGNLRRDLSFKQDQSQLDAKLEAPCCEIEALSRALDIEKSLITEALDVLKRHGNEHSDPEFSHFLAEKISENHVIRVKHLANHVNTLSQALDSTINTGLVLHIYDTQLLK